MSIRVMSNVWQFGPRDKSEVLVLLALADYCNDEGECWPAMSSIASKARMTERGVQKICARLVESGWLEIDLRKGRKGCNLYRIKTPNHVHPEPSSPRTTKHETPNPVPKNPEPRSPEPSITTNNPSGSNTAREITSILEQWASPEAVLSFVSYRRKQKGKALSVTAAKRLAKNLQEIFNAGGDTDDALGMAEERGWQSVQASWYFNAKGNSSARTNQPHATPSNGAYGGNGRIGSGEAAAFAAVAARMLTGEG